jgi:DNA repair exonuclease SbcCD ATPase subunit
MGYSVQDITEMLKNLQKDLTSFKTRVSELQRAIAELSVLLPDQSEGVACPRCDLRFSSERRVAEHLENVHGVREQVKA